MPPPTRGRAAVTRRTIRRRRLTALTVLGILVAAVAVAVAVTTGGGSRPGGGQRVTAGGAGAQVASSHRPTAAGRSGDRQSRTSAASASQDRSRPTNLRVGRLSLVLDEPAAAAIATGHTSSGAPARVLPTNVRFPELRSAGSAASSGATPDSAGGPFPLVVFSQGFDLPAEGYAGLLQAWARAGYVVADPVYPHTNPGAPEGVDESDIVHHPADLRYVISALIAADRDPHSRLHGLIDTRHVAVVGHSDGGEVSLAVAANTCCHDSAVRAAVILSGAELGEFGGTYYRSGAVPLLVTQGSADTINVPGCSAQLYDQAPSPKYYLGIAGAEHEPPYLEPGAEREGVARAVLTFLNAYLKGRRGALGALVRRGRVGPGESLTSAPSLGPAASTLCPGAP